MEKYTYLIVNFLSVIVCFIYSFHPKVRFDKYFLPFIKASVVVAIPFIIWDVLFTKMGVWWFNDRYLVGVRILGLPLEEWMFFICIPFACTYSYYCLNKFFKLRFRDREFFMVCIFISLVIVAFNTDKIYTWVTFLLAAFTMLILKFVLKADWLKEASIAYLVLQVPFFIVNGVLTGTGLEEAIVNYNNQHFWDIRILTVPIEDSVYGYSMVIWNIYFFKKFSKWK